MLRTSRSGAAAAAPLLLMSLCAAWAQSGQENAPGGTPRVIPLPSRETRGTVPPPPSQAPRGRQAEPTDRGRQTEPADRDRQAEPTARGRQTEPDRRRQADPSDTVAQQDDLDFSPRHSRRSSRLEEREFPRERWRDDRDRWRDERGPGRRRGESDRDRPREDRELGRRQGEADRDRPREDVHRDRSNTAVAAPQAKPNASANAVADATPIWLDRACSPDRDQRVAAYLAAIEQRTSPTADQRVQLEALKKAGTTAGELLRAACDAPPALTPTRQVEVVEQRAKAVISAIDVLKPALETFYAALDDEQKARFNTLPTASADSARTSRPNTAAQATGSQRAYRNERDSGPEGARSADEMYEPRRQKRRVRRYRGYYPW